MFLRPGFPKRSVRWHHLGDVLSQLIWAGDHEAVSLCPALAAADAAGPGTSLREQDGPRAGLEAHVSFPRVRNVHFDLSTFITVVA